MREGTRSIVVDCLKVTQPLGDFYIASMKASDLVDITFFDVRRVLLEQRDVERYLGVQRELNPKRVKEIGEYVKTADACFPTGVIVAVPAKCVEMDDDGHKITLSNFIDEEDEENSVLYRNIARVLDGQHRLAGLEDYEGDFDINVSIFVDVDISDQANIFSTVNLAQTKVNKSLVYDLFDLMKSRSPQKSCHNIAITLDRDKDSPFYRMIKRLGVATKGREGETLTQAAFIEPLLKLVSDNPMRDRDTYLRKEKPEKIEQSELHKHPFQHMFVNEDDFDITDILWSYFSAVKKRWPEAWSSRERGVILNRTNGYRALIQFLKYLYTHQFMPSEIKDEEDFTTIFEQIRLKDEDFNTDKFKPGAGGERALRDYFISEHERH